MATHELPWIGFALYLPFGASKVTFVEGQAGTMR